jgi:hypothetical protein
MSEEQHPHPTQNREWLESISTPETRRRWEIIMASISKNENATTRTDSERVPVRELSAYRPIFWFELPEGPERDLLRKEQEQPGYKHFNR